MASPSAPTPGCPRRRARPAGRPRPTRPAAPAWAGRCSRRPGGGTRPGPPPTSHSPLAAAGRAPPGRPAPPRRCSGGRRASRRIRPKLATRVTSDSAAPNTTFTLSRNSHGPRSVAPAPLGIRGQALQRGIRRRACRRRRDDRQRDRRHQGRPERGEARGHGHRRGDDERRTAMSWWTPGSRTIRPENRVPLCGTSLALSGRDGPHPGTNDPPADAPGCWRWAWPPPCRLAARRSPRAPPVGRRARRRPGGGSSQPRRRQRPRSAALGTGGSGTPGTGGTTRPPVTPPETEVRQDFEVPRGGARFVYVANRRRDSVSVIDSTGLGIRTVAGGRQPRLPDHRARARTSPW